MTQKKTDTKQPKTETIKERSIYVYLPSKDMVDEWKKKAQAAGMSTSKFVIENVEGGLRRDEEGFTPRADLLERVTKLEEENTELRKKTKILDSAINNLESELQHYRSQPFLNNNFTGFRKYEKDLIHLLSKRKKVESTEILNALGIDPTKSDVVKAINRQLENLERYGLVRPVLGGWEWQG